jgi:hypothetical protein
MSLVRDMLEISRLLKNIHSSLDRIEWRLRSSQLHESSDQDRYFKSAEEKATFRALLQRAGGSLDGEWT